MDNAGPESELHSSLHYQLIAVVPQHMSSDMGRKLGQVWRGLEAAPQLCIDCCQVHSLLVVPADPQDAALLHSSFIMLTQCVNDICAGAVKRLK